MSFPIFNFNFLLKKKNSSLFRIYQKEEEKSEKQEKEKKKEEKPQVLAIFHFYLPLKLILPWNPVFARNPPKSSQKFPQAPVFQNPPKTFRKK